MATVMVQRTRQMLLRTQTRRPSLAPFQLQGCRRPELLRVVREDGAAEARSKLQEMGVSKVGERLRIGQALARVITAKSEPSAAAVSPPLPPAPPSGRLPCVYVNLASRTDRRATMESSLAAAGFTEYERIEAITGEKAPASVVGHTWDTTLNSKFDRNCTKQPSLGMSGGERGCCASHAMLWQRCADTNTPLLILEDDLNFVSSSSPNVCASARALVKAIETGIDRPEDRTYLLYLGADAKCREGAPSLKGQQASWAARSSGVPIEVKEAEWAWQTHAYIIWPAAAKVLLGGLPMDAPVDVFLSTHFYERRLCGLVCEPELATQIDPYHGGDVEHSSLADRPAMGPHDYGRRRERGLK